MLFRSPVSLPGVRVGQTKIAQNFDPAVPTPLVDEIVKRAGGAATLFQRMNEQGDMLRVATSVVGADGRRAVGTFIPAVGPDGKRTPVVDTVLRGETFVGRAQVVGQWHLTAYQPIKDAAGKVVGALFFGLSERNAAVGQSVTADRKSVV